MSELAGKAVLVTGASRGIGRAAAVALARAGAEVDVWAMAASLYDMLTGAVPRDHDPWLVVLESPPVPIRRRRPWLPAALAEVIDRALVEEPESPFETAAEIKAALECAF